MSGEFISTLIEAGIAGVFAVFAIFLFKEGAKTLHDTQHMFIEFLEAERKQRAEVMAVASRNLAELTATIRVMNGARERTKPRKE